MGTSTLWLGSSIKMKLTNPHYTGDTVQGSIQAFLWIFY